MRGPGGQASHGLVSQPLYLRNIGCPRSLSSSHPVSLGRANGPRQQGELLCLRDMPWDWFLVQAWVKDQSKDFIHCETLPPLVFAQDGPWPLLLPDLGALMEAPMRSGGDV